MISKTKIFDYMMLCIIILVVGAGIYTKRFLVNPVTFLVGLGALGNCIVRVLPQNTMPYWLKNDGTSKWSFGEKKKLVDYAVVIAAFVVVILFIATGQALTRLGDFVISLALFGCFCFQIYNKEANK